MKIEFLMLTLMLLVIAVSATGYTIWLRAQAKSRGELRIIPKRFITGNELDFYKKLLQASAGHFTVMAQVSMGAIVDTALNSSHPDYWEVRKKFSSKIIDFVLCDPKTLAPVLIVELDDRTHDFDKDAIRDSFLAMAGFRSIRFWSRNKPTVPELRQHLLKAVGRQELKSA